MISIAAIQEWIGLLDQVVAGGSAVVSTIKAALAQHGIEADTAALDQVIADAQRRKALAAADAQGVIVAGSTGE